MNFNQYYYYEKYKNHKLTPFHFMKNKNFRNYGFFFFLKIKRNKKQRKGHRATCEGLKRTKHSHTSNTHTWRGPVKVVAQVRPDSITRVLTRFGP